MERKKEGLLESSGDYLTSLSKMDIESYKELGFILRSIVRVSQSAILAKESNIHLHRDWDIYNLLNLVEKFIPDSEMELLDEIYNMKN